MTHAFMQVSSRILRRIRGAKKVVSDVEESPSFLPSCLEMSITSEENASLQGGKFGRPHGISKLDWPYFEYASGIIKFSHVLIYKWCTCFPTHFPHVHALPSRERKRTKHPRGFAPIFPLPLSVSPATPIASVSDSGCGCRTRVTRLFGKDKKYKYFPSLQSKPLLM